MGVKAWALWIAGVPTPQRERKEQTRNHRTELATDNCDGADYQAWGGPGAPKAFVVNVASEYV